MQMQQYEHVRSAGLVMAERISARVDVTRDGLTTSFFPGDYVVIVPGDNAVPVVNFVHRDEFEPFYKITDRVQQIVEQAPPGREQRVIDLD